MRKVFLSYPRNSNNLPFIEQLQIEMEKRDNYAIYPQINCGVDYTTSIADQIDKCDILIAFLIENDPNVMNVAYELGYAMGRGKKILIVAEQNSFVPFDVRLAEYVLLSNYDSVRMIYNIIDVIERIKPINQKPDSVEVRSYRDLLNLYCDNPFMFEQIEPVDFENAIYEWFISKGIKAEKNIDYRDLGDFILTGYNNNRKTLVEVKKYNLNKRVSVGVLQRFLGAIYFSHSDSGIFISSSGYTDSAIHFAKSSYPQIELWDMERILAHLNKNPS